MEPDPADLKSVEVATDRITKDLDRALDHSQHLSQRAATLVGFAGVTLALTAAQARALFADQQGGTATSSPADLGEVGEPLTIVLLALAAVLLALGSAVLIRVLVPPTRPVGARDFFSSAREDLTALWTESPSSTANETRDFLMRIDLALLNEQRAVNVEKFGKLSTGTILVLAGIGALAVEVLVPLAASLSSSVG